MQSRLWSLFSKPADAADFASIYGEELPRVYNFFRYRVGDGPIAEDLTSATFEKAWRHRQRYRRDLAAFSTWLFVIARRVVADHFRSNRPTVRLSELSDLADEHSTEDAAQARADFARLSVLLARLPDREQELVALKYGAGLTNRAIARITGLTESNVGTILHRVTRQLRADWEAEP